MIDCKTCSDKMQCLTGNIKECRRGFMLKRCCREYLINRRKHLLRVILTMPEEMVKDGKMEINEVCRSCGKKIHISLSIGDIAITKWTERSWGTAQPDTITQPYTWTNTCNPYTGQLNVSGDTFLLQAGS